MKKTLLLLSVVFALGCSKSEEKPDNSGKTLSATYTFSPGASSAYGGYYDNVRKQEIGFDNLNSLKNFTDVVRVGDNIKLYMNTVKQPVGNFSIRLTIGGKLVQEVTAKNGDRNIQLLHKVSDKDFE